MLSLKNEQIEQINERIEQNQPGWVCPTCKLVRGKDRVDPCLGCLPGVAFACCGHGGKGTCPGYISFTNGTVIRFEKLTGVERWVGNTLVEHVV